jgi:CcmD family protein
MMNAHRSPGFAWQALILVLVVFAWASPVVAEQGADGTPAAAWSGGWNAGVAPGSAPEQVSGEMMVVLAYGAIWILLLVFVWRIHSQMATLRRETAELRRLLDERIPDQGSRG